MIVVWHNEREREKWNRMTGAIIVRASRMHKKRGKSKKPKRAVKMAMYRQTQIEPIQRYLRDWRDAFAYCWKHWRRWLTEDRSVVREEGKWQPNGEQLAVDPEHLIGPYVALSVDEPDHTGSRLHFDIRLLPFPVFEGNSSTLPA